MPLVVKIMSGENGPDCDTRKSYKLLSDVTSVEFGRDDEPKRASLFVWFKGDPQPEVFYPLGNVYVMNEAGKTISSFGVAPLEGEPVPA